MKTGSLGASVPSSLRAESDAQTPENIKSALRVAMGDGQGKCSSLEDICKSEASLAYMRLW